MPAKSEKLTSLPTKSESLKQITNLPVSLGSVTYELGLVVGYFKQLSAG